MISLNQLRKICAALAALSTTFAFHSSFAQAADATLTFAGQVTANTCVLNVSDSINSTKTVGGTRSVSIANGTTSATSAGTLFGTATTITLGVQVSSADSTACTISGGTSKWNAVFDLPAGTVNSSISGKPYLLNTAVSGAATGVGIALLDSTGTIYPTLLTGAGVGGTKVASASVTASTTLQFQARLMTTTTSAPGVGLVAATVPLTLVYN